MERISNKADARHELAKYDDAKVRDGVRTPKRLRPAKDDPRLQGQGMDGFEADYDQLVRTDAHLASLERELLEQLAAAQRLDGPLGDGKGPVAAHMRRSFLKRTDDAAGVRAALKSYLGELEEVRAAIRSTLAGYRTVDESIATNLGHMGRSKGEQA
ncbi:hypothetical protein EV193_103264 [Herbihabitans rhizosphaerae]|uniref:Excreted virulence factor EspC (Type VII ESX diderm) n=1 Tax=Herbihabitans rhizosphaerae TaxID=1872711 RepID=A0A4Q7KWI6_9PSEU|nr:hypothetical protein [Herbihabitans rhizosphaerae]RZS40946.1 hypothetical protein EV193_103264 [Herbihabitans rhizosphaerae]